MQTLTSEQIFTYVWQHFCLVFPAATNLQVEYGNARSAKVKIQQTAASFLEKRLPFPEQSIHITWSGKSIPIFFHGSGGPEIISDEEGTVTINYDIIGSAFYLLSGWQEFHSVERDTFGRFPYDKSIQFKHNFITVPVVNYYFDILKTALEKAYGISLKTAGWKGKPFATFLSHDIDRLESGWKIEGLKQLKKGKFLNFAKLLIAKASGKDHWNNLETVVKIVKKYGAASTVFWLTNHQKFGKYPNADYVIAKPEFQKLIKNLEKEGFENGVHGSFGTSENSSQIIYEKDKISPQARGNRFHYLCYEPKVTPAVLEAAGIAFDSTLGFAEHFGFRNSFCFPFYPFNFKTGKACSYLEIPLNLMDTTLWHPNYLQLQPTQILPAISPMLREIDKFGGVFGLLWHNENFSEFNTQNGLAVFKEIMQHLKNSNASFLTGLQIMEAYTGKR